MPCFRWLLFGLFCVALALGCGGSESKVPEYKPEQQQEKLKDKGMPKKGIPKAPAPNPDV
jgi:hypothetical protein